MPREIQKMAFAVLIFCEGFASDMLGKFLEATSCTKGQLNSLCAKFEIQTMNGV